MVGIKISMYLIKSKKNDRNLAPVYCRIAYLNGTINLSTDIFLDPLKWVKKKQKVKSTHDRYFQLNLELKNFEDKIYAIYDDLVSEGAIITLKTIKDRFRNKNVQKDSLKESYDYYIRYMEERLGSTYALSTIKQYKTNKTKMVEYLKDKFHFEDISLNRIDYEFIIGFEAFLKIKYKNRINTIDKEIKRFKAVINMSIKLGRLQSNPFKSYTGKTEATNRQFLTKHELQSIEKLVLPENTTLKSVRDMFLFMTYTGLSYGDLIRLTSAHITLTNNNSLFIEIDRDKSNGHSPILLFPKAVHLIEIYQNHPRSLNSGNIFPNFCNNTLNENLKKVAKQAGVTKPLTCHIARHTFATLSLESGVPIETVSKVLGHASLRTTQIYAKVTRHKIEEDYKLMDSVFN